MIPEAPLERNDTGGLVPQDEGWFVVNAREARWQDSEFGPFTRFEGTARFPQVGINIGVLDPGQPACWYHREDEQEDFLVLHGEALLLVEDQERPLKAWDFLHCPPGTDHIIVGAGDGPCLIFMTGARLVEKEVVYPRSEVALRHGAGVEADTSDRNVAYAPFPKWQPGPPASWEGLPWA